MLRGYRLLVLALGLVLAGAAPPKEGGIGKAPAEKIKPSAPKTPDYSAYPDKEAESCYTAKDHDSADLCAQWRAAIAAEKAAKATEGGNLVGGIGAEIGRAHV